MGWKKKKAKEPKHDCLMPTNNTETVTETKTIGQIGYEAYAARTFWKSLATGSPLPQWHHVKSEIQLAWQAAGEAMVYAAMARHSESPTWPHVVSFAWLMEQKLAQNRHKGNREGWINTDVRLLMNLLKGELRELETAYMDGDAANVQLEAADVANFAMMIADWFKSRC